MYPNYIGKLSPEDASLPIPKASEPIRLGGWSVTKQEVCEKSDSTHIREQDHNVGLAASTAAVACGSGRCSCKTGQYRNEHRSHFRRKLKITENKNKKLSRIKCNTQKFL